MGKAPAFQFYPGDWVRDQQLGMTSMSTRGIWIGLLCAMWQAEPRGVLEADCFAFMRLVGCNDDEWRLFLDDAKAFKFCDIFNACEGGQCVANTRIESRRMIRDEAIRRADNERQSRHRSRSCHADVTPDVTVLSQPSSARKMKTEEEDLFSLGVQKEEREDLMEPQDVVDGWNEICAPHGLPAVREFSASRMKHVKARLKEHPTVDFWQEALNRVRTQPFLLGTNDRGWKASFDWIIENDTNLVKVLEGRYVEGERNGFKPR